MLDLQPANVILDLDLDSKEEVLAYLSNHLEQKGSVAPGFLDALLTREQTASTCLGQGVAIPHPAKDSNKVLHSTILACRLSKPLVWNDEGEEVQLIFVLAVQGSEHLEVLQSLALLLDEEEAIHALLEVNSEKEFCQIFSQEEASSATAIEDYFPEHNFYKLMASPQLLASLNRQLLLEQTNKATNREIVLENLVSSANTEEPVIEIAPAIYLHGPQLATKANALVVAYNPEENFLLVSVSNADEELKETIIALSQAKISDFPQPLSYQSFLAWLKQ